MADLAQTQLIPIQELTPGQIGTIRNGAIEFVVARAMKELGMTRDRLVVRDIRPVADLAMYSNDTSAATLERWVYGASAAASGFTAVSPTTGTMGDNKFVCVFGVRDLGGQLGIDTGGASATGPYSAAVNPSHISFVKFNIGGSDKVIWDIQSVRAYKEMVAFSPSPILIPQNTGFVLYYYLKGNLACVASMGAVVADSEQFLQLLGVTVEPRGLTISP